MWRTFKPTVERVKELLDIAVDFQSKRNVPLFCGEFGVYIPNSNNEGRVYWYNVVRSYIEEKGYLLDNLGLYRWFWAFWAFLGFMRVRVRPDSRWKPEFKAPKAAIAAFGGISP